jgi:hypothetical protein
MRFFTSILLDYNGKTRLFSANRHFGILGAFRFAHRGHLTAHYGVFRGWVVKSYQRGRKNAVAVPCRQFYKIGCFVILKPAPGLCFYFPVKLCFLSLCYMPRPQAFPLLCPVAFSFRLKIGLFVFPARFMLFYIPARLCLYSFI